eukprot:m.298972 g.298972  ORF g.298972 m.298972 type:complete len:311 (+) comp27226_c0_seq11:1985-2917(+)
MILVSSQKATPSAAARSARARVKRSESPARASGLNIAGLSPTAGSMTAVSSADNATWRSRSYSGLLGPPLTNSAPLELCPLCRAILPPSAFISATHCSIAQSVSASMSACDVASSFGGQSEFKLNWTIHRQKWGSGRTADSSSLKYASSSGSTVASPIVWSTFVAKVPTTFRQAARSTRLLDLVIPPHAAAEHSAEGDEAASITATAYPRRRSWYAIETPTVPAPSTTAVFGMWWVVVSPVTVASPPERRKNSGWRGVGSGVDAMARRYAASAAVPAAAPRTTTRRIILSVPLWTLGSVKRAVTVWHDLF